MRQKGAILLLITAMLILAVAPVFAQKAEKPNPYMPWKSWKSIDAAIALRDLDGPEDIVEKAEIIEDRIDELKDEEKELGKGLVDAKSQLTSLKSQKDVLQGLADVKMGGDQQTRRRLQELTHRIRQKEKEVKLRLEAGGELDKEIDRLTEMAVQYREKARQLEIRERQKQ